MKLIIELIAITDHVANQYCLCFDRNTSCPSGNVKTVNRRCRVENLDMILCFLRELRLSNNYTNYVFDHSMRLAGEKFDCDNYSIFNLILSVRITNNITQLIDRSSNHRFLKLVTIRHHIEENLSWLSTLGGAFSSLGECDTYFALKAGEISLSQLRLASVCGDPNIIARCGIYLVFSLCQRQQKNRARRLIKRVVYPYISSINYDKVLKNMYKAACYKVKTLSESTKIGVL